MDDAEIETLEFLLSQTVSLPAAAAILKAARNTATVGMLRAGVHEIATPNGNLYPRSEVEEMAKTFTRRKGGRPKKT